MTVSRSIEGRAIRAYVGPGAARRTIIVLGGVHGDEPKSVYVSRRLIKLLEGNFDAFARESLSPRARRALTDVRWVVADVVNPDGYERRKRRNADLIDINRNFPTRNWERTSRRSRMFGGDAPGTEPETRAVVKIVRRYRPSLIIAVHSISHGKHCNNYDGPARVIALRMKRRNGYPVTASLGYATPGSLGTWAGRERSIPTITLELPSRHSPKRCWEDNWRALLESV